MPDFLAGQARSWKRKPGKLALGFTFEVSPVSFRVVGIRPRDGRSRRVVVETEGDRKVI